MTKKYRVVLIAIDQYVFQILQGFVNLISLLGIANQVTKAISNSLNLGTEVRKKCPSELFLEW